MKPGMGPQIRVIGGAIAVLAVVAAALLWRDVETQEPPARSDAASQEAAPSVEPDQVPIPDANGDVASSNSAEDAFAPIERDLAAARAENEAATAALTRAQRDLDDLEREIDAVERYVEDLMERGEDPAKHAEEGMERLRPVIERYEARLEAVMTAEARAESARARLEAAKADLGAITN
jgi:hypothetical protein